MKKILIGLTAVAVTGCTAGSTVSTSATS
ncbi:MAG: hypothetical protein QOE24_3121, partial [Frankiales bacterium]|nr:hypothetical protein [Frankiales bacterium]